jgi:hypothetical protein
MLRPHRDRRAGGSVTGPFRGDEIVKAEINRRITGDGTLSPPTYFARVYCRRRRPRALSVGSSDAAIELLQIGACDSMVAVDTSPERLEHLRASLPSALMPRLELVWADVASWTPPGRFDLVVCTDALSATAQPDELLSRIAGALQADGLLYLDEFVGPGRGTSLRELLGGRFETLEERWSGSAILPEAELDGDDHVWGVYRRSEPRRLASGTARTDGRLDSVDEGLIAGWAMNPSELDQRLTVDLYLDHRLAARTVANLPRSDLARAGVGDGAYAFTIELPTWARDGREHPISVVTPASGIPLPAARGFERRRRPLPDGTRLTWARHDPTLPPLPPARVLAGRDGWAFGCDDAVGTIEQLRGRLALTAPDLRQWRSLVERQARLLRAAGIPYIVAVAPAKAAVHPEQLPTELGPPALGRQLVEVLGDVGAVVVDLHGPLLSAAGEGRKLYYMRDPAWTYEGAAVAADALLAAARSAGVRIAALDPDGIRWNREMVVGSLDGRPMVTLEDGRLRPAPSVSSAESSPRPDEHLLGLTVCPTPQELSVVASEVRVIRCATCRGQTTALVLHDPGGSRLEPFLAHAVASSTWISGRMLSRALVEAVAPSIVFQVLDESLLVRVPYGLDG